MFKHFEKWQMKEAGKEALKAIQDLGISMLTNEPEKCCDQTHHDEICVHEKEDETCPKCVHCDSKRLYKSDVFWYTSRNFTERYRQEKAKVGDTFYDGDNGDKHEVVAVDLESSRLVYRNCDQCEKLLDIACW